LIDVHNSPVQNEIRAIKKLCNSTHRNIIQVFDTGQLPNSAYAFIDMELCDLNLDQYNKSMSTVSLVHDDTSHLREVQVWNIMVQITSGITFIHGKGEVHRDLKPQNGTSLSHNLF
jgi:serine/threonine protein kinase